ncbi:3-hydroxy-3-methylglutaryl-coenzyme A reductase [Capsicum baccatum]|uniref:3-hydroxy-3-methylglutaryl-coenzyme A reductase n=1 Tax=Capsicum baccatum TaxID=33114 RepID=A0A2G2XDH7_CAPBA|nr:3-hydroxy-3-methylglutaryl-coenzyme A reductase [Capsicum baccatum]
MIEAINDGKNLYVSVTMTCTKVDTGGGGTQLASKSAWLNLLDGKGACRVSPTLNSRLLAAIVVDSVLAGELSFRKRLN